MMAYALAYVDYQFVLAFSHLFVSAVGFSGIP